MKNNYSNLRIAIVAASSTQSVVGGAERFYEGLHRAIQDFGIETDLLAVPADESSFEQILENYQYCYNMQLQHYDAVISTKAPTYAVKHPRHILYLVHTIRVFYDMFDYAFPKPTPIHFDQKRRIHELDRATLSLPHQRFSIGHEVLKRLQLWNRLDATVLHPPLAMDRFREGEIGDYLFLPGRLHPWKRVDLIINAVKLCKQPIRLLIAGTGEAEKSLKTLADGNARIRFLGRVSDKDLIELYANALAVPFTPVREDYGYITLEAFRSGKPVITCTDSGEPLHFVNHGQTGFISKPDPQTLANFFDYLFKNRNAAAQMGRQGRASIAHIQWDTVVQTLLTAAFENQKIKTYMPGFHNPLKVGVLDMQPIDPPVGGGRLRLLGLYHALGQNITTRYVGTYDWRGESYRRHALSPTLEEINIPLSDVHHDAAERLRQEAGGKVVIDVAFPELGGLSPDYIAGATDLLAWAEVVVFSHPWVYPLVADHLSAHQLVVYDSQNVEGFLRAQILDETNPVEARLLRGVVEAEYRLGCRADLVLACSHEDRELFNRIYDWSMDKIRVVPNGVMSTKLLPASVEQRQELRIKYNLPAKSAICVFVGTDYNPNVEAANFIVYELAPVLHEVTFLILGSVGGRLSPSKHDNLRITGFVEDAVKQDLLRVCDFALNPMFSGSGTNIKMFDYMSAGLPVISTPTGARGIETAGRLPIRLANPDRSDFLIAIRELVDDQNILSQRAEDARACVEEDYAWERISPLLGRLFQVWYETKGSSKPFYSVVIPTYERHDQLNELMYCLQGQIEQDFEVVIVDQSAMRWVNAERDFGFPMHYIHTDVRGAVRARNTGAYYSRGQVIAFTDDDCRPQPTWLYAARKYFDVKDVQGVEGLIESDHHDDPNYRAVTNVGFEGIGFMTANLLVRAEAFHALNGFDPNFDRPHFREDTDFGWRLELVGKVIFAHDVSVFHPAQPRVTERESQLTRSRFFEKDALLFAKHPDRYWELFHREEHWKKTPGFWENLERGAIKYSINIEKFFKYKLVSR